MHDRVTWLDRHARRRAADRLAFRTPAPICRRASSARLASPWLGAARRRLADRPALRLRRRPRRDRSSAPRSRAPSSTSTAIRPAPRSIPARRRPGSARPTTFDGEPLYRAGAEPDAGRDRRRRERYFAPYHAALQAEIDAAARRARQGRRSTTATRSARSSRACSTATLPQFNIGTNDGATCDRARPQAAGRRPAGRHRSQPCRQRPLQGRLDHPPLRPARQRRPRHPDGAGHAAAIMREPPGTGTPETWPAPYDADYAAPLRATLTTILDTAIAWRAPDRRPLRRQRMTTRLDNARIIRARDRHRADRQELADRSAAAHADEQSRSRRRREARASWSSMAASAAPRATGRASTASSRRCAARGRRDAAGPVGQAGRRVPHPRRCAARADRQLQPRAALGDLGAFQRARSQGPDDVRPDDGRLVDLHRHPGHRAGHLRDLRRDGPPALRRRPRRPLDPDRRPRRHGRRAAAGRDDGRRLVPRRRMPAEPHRDAAAHRLSRRRRPRTLDEALAIIDAAARRRSRSRSACSAMPPRSCPNWSGAACGPTA